MEGGVSRPLLVVLFVFLIFNCAAFYFYDPQTLHLIGALAILAVVYWLTFRLKRSEAFIVALTFFGFYNLITLSLAVALPNYLSALLAAIFSTASFIFAIYLELNEINLEVFFYGNVIAIVIAEIYIAASLWNATRATTPFLMTIYFYLFWQIILAQQQGQLNSRTIIRNVSIFIAASALILMTGL